MDKRLSLLYTSLGLALLLALFQFLSFAFYLSWSYWWFDVLMHYFAGVIGGLSTYWVLFHSGIFFKEMPSKRFSVITVFVCVLIAGIAWEFAEFFYGITDSHEGLALDITNDLIMDSLGAISAALIARRRSHG
jgi:hypothetical protein